MMLDDEDAGASWCAISEDVQLVNAKHGYKSKQYPR